MIREKRMPAPMKHRSSELRKALEKSKSIRQALITVGMVPAGGNYETARRLIKENNIDVSHMTGRGWNIGDSAGLLKRKAIPLGEILVDDSNYRGGTWLLKRRLIQRGLKENACERCRKQSWNGEPIPLELEHINGKRTDNRIENLRLLCPNCHAQTPTYRGKNIGNCT